MNVPVRKAAWSPTTPANGWSEDLRWYAAAVHQMKRLTPGLDEFRPLALRANELLGDPDLTPAAVAELEEHLAALVRIARRWSDPRSLGYQAQVHATFIADASRWPRHKRKRVLWEECAHGNWFFLPWHRAYLLEFESVARAHIKELGGPHESWALPYWNSSDYRKVPDAATLPLALRPSVVPDGVEVAGMDAAAGPRPNPLHEPSRRGPRPLPPEPSFRDWPDASEALLRKHYANAQDTNLVSFAGGYLEDLAFFHSSDELGQIDVKPHGGGHMAVHGFMASFTTAGLDPVFWMHHANVDRLWETYAHDLDHGYPFAEGRPGQAPGTEAFDSWSGHGFRFLRPDGTIATWTAPELLDVEDLGYRYDTTAPPQFNFVPTPPLGADIDPFGLDQPDFTPVSAASDISVTTARTIDIGSGAGVGGVDPSQRWVIRFDGIRCRRPAETSYAVFIDSGGDGVDVDVERHLVGTLTLFGVFESSLESSGNRGSSRVLDASGVVQALPAFDPLAARLTLVPSDEDRDLVSMGLSIERVSLEVG